MRLASHCFRSPLVLPSPPRRARLPEPELTLLRHARRTKPLPSPSAPPLRWRPLARVASRLRLPTLRRPDRLGANNSACNGEPTSDATNAPATRKSRFIPSPTAEDLEAYELASEVAPLKDDGEWTPPTTVLLIGEGPDARFTEYIPDRAQFALDITDAPRGLPGDV
jgi:hypothetical protein